MNSSASQVFGTPELLEAILAQLPVRDLLLAQRICTEFRKAITSSPPLQQLLFFRPKPFKDPKTWTVNALLREVFPPYFITSQGDVGFPAFKAITMLNFNTKPNLKNAFLSPDASWRRMFLIQPPPLTLFIDRRSNSGRYFGVSRKTATVSFDREINSGVTMDALFDITLSFTARELGPFFVSFNENEASSPSMTLFLHEKPGFLDDSMHDSDLESHCKDMPWKEIRFTDDKELVRNDPFGTFDFSGWKTDLTSEKGGVSLEQYKSWTDKMDAFGTEQTKSRSLRS